MPEAAESDQWVYLFTNLEPCVKTNSFVGIAQNPLDELQKRHEDNTETSEWRTNATVTSDKGSKGWRLELVLGPFSNKAGAQTIRDTWRKRSRGIVSRRKAGMKIWRELNRQRRQQKKPTQVPFRLFDTRENSQD